MHLKLIVTDITLPITAHLSKAGPSISPSGSLHLVPVGPGGAKLTVQTTHGSITQGTPHHSATVGGARGPPYGAHDTKLLVEAGKAAPTGTI